MEQAFGMLLREVSHSLKRVRLIQILKLLFAELL